MGKRTKVKSNFVDSVCFQCPIFIIDLCHNDKVLFRPHTSNEFQHSENIVDIRVIILCSISRIILCVNACITITIYSAILYVLKVNKHMSHLITTTLQVMDSIMQASWHCTSPVVSCSSCMYVLEVLLIGTDLHWQQVRTSLGLTRLCMCPLFDA